MTLKVEQVYSSEYRYTLLNCITMKSWLISFRISVKTLSWLIHRKILRSLHDRQFRSIRSYRGRKRQENRSAKFWNHAKFLMVFCLCAMNSDLSILNDSMGLFLMWAEVLGLIELTISWNFSSRFTIQQSTVACPSLFFSTSTKRKTFWIAPSRTSTSLISSN